jgi:hypothetical protein
MRNELFGLPGRIICGKKIMSMLQTLSRLFRSWRIWPFPFKQPCTTHAFFPDSYLIIARVSVAHFPRFAQYFMHTRCRTHRDIASVQVPTP